MNNIILKVNGSEIPLNAFVSKTFINVVEALVNSLDKIPEDKKQIEIVVK